MERMDYEKRKQVAEWLNSLGYMFELDEDGLWMEDYDFAEHKTKDVIDIVLAWEEKNNANTYHLTIDELITLCRDFTVDCHDGYVSNDHAYIENKLNNEHTKNN